MVVRLMHGRLRLTVTVVGILCLIVLPAVVAPLVAQPCATAVAETWVKQLAPAEFDRYLTTAITNVPQPYRVALLHRATPLQRSVVWRQAMDEVRRTYTSRFPRTYEREALLNRLHEFASPERLTESALNEGDKQQLRALEAETVSAFDRSVAWQLLRGAGALSSRGEAAGLPWSERWNFFRTKLPGSFSVVKTWSAVTLHAAAYEDCNCADSNDCDIDYSCRLPNEGVCRVWGNSGCGPLHMSECVAVCVGSVESRGGRP